MSVGQFSPLLSLFSRFLTLSARAAESTHQINTEEGIVFRLETAQRVMDKGSTWKCMNCGCENRAVPMQISVSLKSNLILEFNNAFREKMDFFGVIRIQTSAFLTYQRHRKPVDGGSLLCFYQPPALVKLYVSYGNYCTLSILASELFSAGLSGAVGKTHSG